MLVSGGSSLDIQQDDQPLDPSPVAWKIRRKGKKADTGKTMVTTEDGGWDIADSENRREDARLNQPGGVSESEVKVMATNRAR
jgi:hypothetical protein